MTQVVTSSHVLIVMLATSLMLIQVQFMAMTWIANPETQGRIDNVCRSNEDYGFCNKVFQADLPRPEVGYVGLTKITIMEAQRNASNTLNFIRAQIPVENDPAKFHHYKVCEQVYSQLKLRFDRAFDAFNQGDYLEVHCQEWDTPRIQAGCVTIFYEPLGEDPLNERNRCMRILITMAVVTVSNLVN